MIICSTSCDMTSISREVPSQFHYLVFFSQEEEKIAREYHDPPPCKTVRYANEVHQPKLTGSFCRFLKTLLNNTHCEYSIRCHERSSHSETEDMCSLIPGEHYHILFYIKSFIGVEKFIKENLSEQILKPPKNSKIKNSHVKLFKVSYPENCLQSEFRLSGNRLFIHGDKLIKMLQMKPTLDLGCNFDLTWELQRACYTEFDDCEDIEKLSFLSRQLAKLENSQAVFKDSVLDFIDLLMRGFGTITASHHSSVLSVELGFSEAQCQCLECQEKSQLSSGVDSIANEAVKLDTNLFSYIDENAQFA